MSLTAVLIDRLGKTQNITYSNLNNLKTKFLKKGSGNPVTLNKWDNIIILGFKNGSENNINKHELPPPIDSELFYGDFIVYKHNENFTIENYKEFYNDIFEFEDLDDTLLEDELFLQDEDYDYDDGFLVKEDDEEEFIDDFED